MDALAKASGRMTCVDLGVLDGLRRFDGYLLVSIVAVGIFRLCTCIIMMIIQYGTRNFVS